MLEQYKNRAVESLGRLGSESLKALLCRIVGRIFLGTGGATMEPAAMSIRQEHG